MEENIDEILGIVRCARCGHRLEGEIECPFCSLFPDPPRKDVLPKWVYLAACFLTSPISIYAVLKSRRLNIFEKVIAVSGCLFWLGLYILWF
jgi:hypothetical protein